MKTMVTYLNAFLEVIRGLNAAYDNMPENPKFYFFIIGLVAIPSFLFSEVSFFFWLLFLISLRMVGAWLNK